MNDPIRSARRCATLTWIAGLAVVAPLAIWALKPLPAHTMSMPELRPPAEVQASAQGATLDASVFSVRLWNPPPVTASATGATPPPPPPAAPLKLQLIGIVADPAAEEGKPPLLRAALYDPDTDRLYVVAAGEMIGQHRVQEITDQAVTVAAAGERGRAPTRLVLKQPGRGGTP